ncbi:MAG: hypothetical protein VX252_16575 [Myxococcota bacterium]|nr:hypothetical protein [Myxococcota bacterium]
MDARTPILVGVSQANQRDDAQNPQEPIALMQARTREAARDAGCDELVARTDSIGIMQGIWPYREPGSLLKERLGNDRARVQIRPIGGNEGQDLILESLADIQSGKSDVALVTSAETMRTRRRDRKAKRETHYSGDVGDGSVDALFFQGKPMLSAHEVASGMGLATVFYAMIENALRHESRQSFGQHQQEIATLWSSLSEVASRNPHAWVPEAKTPEIIGTQSPDNRPITHPYPKWMTSNIDVDQSAAIFLTSVGTARDLGISSDRWVFPWSGTRAHDHWFPSERDQIHASPAMRIAGRAALEAANLRPEELAWIDLYACFPAAVQVAQAEIGLPVDRVPSVTGGLTFFGGPFNSFTVHSVARMMELAREDREKIGFVSGVGGYFTKHSFGVYSATPPETPYRFHSPQEEIDSLPRRNEEADFKGLAEIEAYSIKYADDGSPAYSVASALTPEGHRTWVRSEEVDMAEAFETNDLCGAQADVAAGNLLGVQTN